MKKKTSVQISAPTSSEPAKLLSVKETAIKVGCSESWLYKMVEWQQVECRRLGLRGRMIRFDPEQVSRLTQLVPSKKAT